MLLPPSLEELRSFPTAPDDLFPLLWQGAYPRIYDRNIPAHQWLSDYTATYVQRDVRQVINVGDLQTFSGFMKLCMKTVGKTRRIRNTLVYGGQDSQRRSDAQVLSWRHLQQVVVIPSGRK